MVQSAPPLGPARTSPSLVRPVGSLASLPPGGGGGGPADAYKVGDAVEYYSSTQSNWIPAKVLAVNLDGTHNLDCKPDVPAGKIRRVAQEPLGSTVVVGKPVGGYRTGDVVEYFTATQSRWIPAKVLKANLDGTWDLDCKPGVQADKIRNPPASAPPSANNSGKPFQAGDIIEYFSPSQGKWIPAKVLSKTADGNFNLDCKPEVHSSKMRHIVESARGPGASKPGDAEYSPGDAVEYFAATQNDWIPAKVLKSNANGTYDLDCKPSVLPEKLRRPAHDAGAAPATYAAGDTVEYFSATQKDWISAKVLSTCSNGNYNLDCKPDVRPDKVRDPQKVSTPRRPGGGKPGGRTFKAGDVVEYYGSTLNKWISAKVLKVNPDGTYNLDCKPNVPPEKVRPVEQASTRTDTSFSVGESVEYFGASQQIWIPAKVLAVNPNGTYNLDCKPEVLPDKIRRPDASNGSTLHSATPMSMSSLTRSSVATTAPAEGFHDPVQLLRVRRSGGAWQYEVCPEAAAALERYGSRRIAVVSICGLQRMGKTYLLNLLVERGQARLRPTEGLWLWGVHSRNNDSDPLIAFIDCEGFGSASGDRARDAQLMTFCGLLSSVLLLNSGGALDESLFDALAPVCRFGENIEERGNEANRPTLMWVLRDCMLELRDAHDRPVAPDEYLEKALHSAPANPDDHGHDVQSARDVRQSLLKFFRHRSCTNLAIPVHDDSQLQRLDDVPYTALRGEFRTGVEKLRAQLISTCLASPKAVGGQPLGCFSFVALLRQLAGAVNDNRILSMKGAWETVQHTACGGLSDELRTSASKLLHTLAAGQSVPGGAKLPLTDDMLYQVLRDSRHTLKARWEECAVGEESVRNEYWQELKETISREEMLVRLQNARLADQQLTGALRSWQVWLDGEDDGALVSDSEICGDLVGMMERMPTVPVARAASAAIMAAARRLSAARNTMATTVEQHHALQQKAVEWGTQAAQQEGQARSLLDAKRAELAEAQAKVDELERTAADLSDETRGVDGGLHDTKTQLKAVLEDIEAARTREHALKAQYRAAAESEASLRSELDQLRAAAAKTDAERLAGERCARTSAEVAATARQRTEEQLAQAKAESAKYAKQLDAERDALKGENEKARAEHMRRAEDVRRQLEEERKALRDEQEKAQAEHRRAVADARRQLEEERLAYAGTLDHTKDRLMQRERSAGILEGKAQALAAETEGLRERLKYLENQVRDAELHLSQQSAEGEQIVQDLQQATCDAEAVRRSGDERMREQREAYEKRIADLEDAEDRRKPKCGCSIQ